ncbi:MAG: putative hydrolase, partial [Mycobacterium sp.]|nr:putative hydrolase [Mycobacterium sp.]
MADLPFGFSSGDDPEKDDRKKDPNTGSQPDPFGFGGGDFDMNNLGQIFSKLGEMFSGAG